MTDNLTFQEVMFLVKMRLSGNSEQDSNYIRQIVKPMRYLYNRFNLEIHIKNPDNIWFNIAFTDGGEDKVYTSSLKNPSFARFWNCLMGVIHSYAAKNPYSYFPGKYFDMNALLDNPGI